MIPIFDSKRQYAQIGEAAEKAVCEVMRSGSYILGANTKALEQALGLQSGALDGASQMTSQYSDQVQQLANEEAEHKTFLDQINAAWEDASLLL